MLNVIEKLIEIGCTLTPVATGERWEMAELRHPRHAKGWWLILHKPTGGAWSVAALEDAQRIIDRVEAGKDPRRVQDAMGATVDA